MSACMVGMADWHKGTFTDTDPDVRLIRTDPLRFENVSKVDRLCDLRGELFFLFHSPPTLAGSGIDLDSDRHVVDVEWSNVSNSYFDFIQFNLESRLDSELNNITDEDNLLVGDESCVSPDCCKWH
jgi:hypothetical protein